MQWVLYLFGVAFLKKEIIDGVDEPTFSDLDPLFNGISNFVGYSMPKPFS